MRTRAGMHGIAVVYPSRERRIHLPLRASTVGPPIAQHSKRCKLRQTFSAHTSKRAVDDPTVDSRDGRCTPFAGKILRSGCMVAYLMRRESDVARFTAFSFLVLTIEIN